MGRIFEKKYTGDRTDSIQKKKLSMDFFFKDTLAIIAYVHILCENTFQKYKNVHQMLKECTPVYYIS